MTYHPLKNIAEWRKGCSCSTCTDGLIKAIENWFKENTSYTEEGVRDIKRQAKEFERESCALDATVSGYHEFAGYLRNINI